MLKIWQAEALSYSRLGRQRNWKDIFWGSCFPR